MVDSNRLRTGGLRSDHRQTPESAGNVPAANAAQRLLSSSANVAMPEHDHFLPSNKEGIMGEFTSGFFMGDSATNGRVLVVDDEAEVRKVVRMTLQKAG